MPKPQRLKTQVNSETQKSPTCPNSASATVISGRREGREEGTSRTSAKKSTGAWHEELAKLLSKEDASRLRSGRQLCLCQLSLPAHNVELAFSVGVPPPSVLRRLQMVELDEVLRRTASPEAVR